MPVCRAEASSCRKGSLFEGAVFAFAKTEGVKVNGTIVGGDALDSSQGLPCVKEIPLLGEMSALPTKGLPLSQKGCQRSWRGIES